MAVVGLGRAFTLMLPTFKRHARVELVAAADPREDARRRFAQDFGGRAYATLEELCADRDVEAVYVATPHEDHAAHASAVMGAGKHVLVEKPMATTLADAEAIVDAARATGMQVVVGPSHSFDAPIARARALVASGELGRVRMITALNFTDFLYRPRRPEELDAAKGGGVTLTQAAHHVDIVRLLGGGRVKSVRAASGAWDPARPVDGAYAVLLTFDDGAFASLSYSGYGHFDADELCGGVSELGREKDAAAYGAARKALAGVDPAAEAEAKNARNYGGANYREPTDAPWHEHFGFLVVSCEEGDIRPTPRGVWVYGNAQRRHEELAKPAVPRAEVLDELCDAVIGARRPLHDGAWGLATLEACLAIRRSAEEGREIELRHQVPVR